MTSPTKSSDETLRESVLQALGDDKRTAALDLRVGVLNAVVHLGGAAATAKRRCLAEAICAGVAGVRGVVNRIQAPGAPDPSRTIHIQLGEHKSGKL